MKQPETPDKFKILIRIGLWGALFFFLALSLVNTDYAQKTFFYPLLYEEQVKEYAEKNNLDAALVAAVIKNESNFKASAVSESGAVGLMQIMPETGSWIAGQMGLADFRPELLSEPQVNIRLGCWYLSELIFEFGDEVPAIAAYNAGRGQVKEWLESGRWDGKKTNQIPFKETRNYVDSVLGNKRVYKKLYEDILQES